MTPRIRSVNVGRIQDGPYSRLGRSGIDKRPIGGRVRARALGLDGDEQANRRYHGGIDQAVYAFAREDLERWERELGRELPDGMFGENLTTTGIDLAAAVIGERWRIGTAEVEVSAPRIPCLTFQRRLGESGWVRRFTTDGRSGAYVRVLVEGELGAGDEIVSLFRPEHGVSTLEVFRAISTERERLPALLEVPQLPAKLHRLARAYLAEARPA